LGEEEAVIVGNLCREKHIFKQLTKRKAKKAN